MMLTGAIFFFYLWNQYKTLKPFALWKTVKAMLPFFPGVLLAFSFLAYHYYKLGWIGYHASMPWAECFEKIDSFKEFGRNVVVMIWRLVDFGRLISWILFFYSIYYLLKYENVRIDKSFSNRQLSVFFLFILMMLISAYSFLFHKLLSGHRYLLPHYAMITMIAFLLLDKFCSWKKIRIIAVFSAVILLSGNLLKYPEKISTGWDSTLSHLPFYGLREQMFDYIQENKIAWDDLSAGFGLYGNQNYIDLSSPKDRIIKDANSEQTPYILYSNISNFSDEIIDRLKNENNYVLVKKFERGNVFISLYKKL